MRPTALDATLPPPPMEATVLAPERIIDGRYRILEQLGEGGMGAVFLAEHLALRKQVALKTIHAELTGHAEIAARFAREAMASARIEHPGVVSAMDFGTLEEGGAFLVMQLVRGESLRQRLERESVLPWQQACELMEQMADAVAAAHAEGIVHRDLKPENVVLESSKTSQLLVRVLDFGIAHLRSESAVAQKANSGAPLTRLGVVMGTPGYMAPEQAVGQAVDEGADIYALGVMLWELLAGHRPFTGETLTEIITKQFGATPPPLPSDGQVVPEGLRVLLESMLRVQPEERVRSAVEVRDRLRTLRLTPETSRDVGLAVQAGDIALTRLRGLGAALQAFGQRLLANPALVRALRGLRERWDGLSDKHRALGIWGACVLALGLVSLVWFSGPSSEPEKPKVAASTGAGSTGTAKTRTKPADVRGTAREPAAPQATQKPARTGAAREGSEAADGSARETNKEAERSGQASGKQGGGRRVGDKLKRAVNSIFN